MVHCGLYTPQNVNGEPCAGSHHQQGNTMLLQWGITPHTYRLMALCPGLPGWAGTRKVKPIWILLKQGSGISWAICKSAPRFRQITTPTPHRSVFYRPDALPAAQPTVSKHWRHHLNGSKIIYSCQYSQTVTIALCGDHTHTHPFNGPFSGTTWVGRYQKGNTNLDFTEARDSERQWHQLGHMQVCTSLQTTMPAPHRSVFYRPDALPTAQPTASKHWREVCGDQCYYINSTTQPQPTTHFMAIIQVNLRYLAARVKNWIILLVQSFTAHMPLLTAASAFGLGRRHWSSPQQSYLCCLCTLK